MSFRFKKKYRTHSNSSIATLTVTGSTALPDANVNSSYITPLTASGGVSPYTWTAVNSLPGGLSVASSGSVLGTPSTTSNSTFTLQVADTLGSTVSQQYRLDVISSGAAAALTITTSTGLPGAIVGSSYSLTFLSTGGVAPYSSYTVIGSLPSGFSLSSSGGLTGTASTTATSTFTIQVKDSVGSTASEQFRFSIASTATDNPELKTTHPMSVADVSSLRARVTSTSYGDRAYLQSVINDLPSQLAAAALVVDSPYTSMVTNAIRRNVVIEWGAVNCAYLAMLDPAQLRTAGMTFTSGYPFTTDSSRTISSNCTADDMADLAHDLLTVYELTNALSSLNAPLVDLVASGRILGSLSDAPHGYQNNYVECMQAPVGMTYDWCYNLWDATQRSRVTATMETAYSTPLYQQTSSAVYRAADSSIDFSTWTHDGSGDPGTLPHFIGTNEAWHLVQRPLLYFFMLNDPEFGTSALRTSVGNNVLTWINRIAYEMRVLGGAGYRGQESLVRYATDGYSRVLTVAGLTRPAYVSSDPWTQAEDNISGIAHCLALMRTENDRGSAFKNYIHALGTMGFDGTATTEGSYLLLLARGFLLASGMDTEAADTQWLLADVGQEPHSESNIVAYRWAQAVLRHGLLWPYRHLVGSSAPATFRRQHAGITVLGPDPTTRGAAQVVSVVQEFAHTSGHADVKLSGLGVSCKGQLVVLRPVEGKQGPFVVAGIDKSYGENGLVLRDTSGKQVLPRGSTALSTFTAPYNTKKIATETYALSTNANYGFVQVDFSDSFDTSSNSTGITGGRRFITNIPSIRMVVDAMLVEGIPSTNTSLYQLWVPTAPTWIGGTVTDAGTSSGFVYWRSSSDATAWDVLNDSSTDIAPVTNQVLQQKRTNARMYVTPLLPATYEMHAKGGADWSSAAGVFWNYQTQADTNTAYSITTKPTTEQRTIDTQRDHAWGRLEVRGVGSTVAYLTALQYGSAASTDTDYVGSTRIAVARIDGGDVWVTHIPHATEPWAVATPKTVAGTNVDTTYAFTFTIATATKVLFEGLPPSAAVGVSGSGTGTVTVTVTGAGAFTSTPQGTLLVTVSTNGTVS